MLKYFYVLCTFLNRSKIAKQCNCKHYTKLELISDFYHTRFWAKVGQWKPNTTYIYFISKKFLWIAIWMTVNYLYLPTQIDT